ncbi:hypothetical protein GH714_005328 [Hevea brasiliensis]|uniref:Leucine-rich repeat-containing N-terminal plant-type domain-containing protein n=1 Tax=Hevea brasiliensis TaxID=3981 RepID=A0A6A6LZ88_HEVBR|nr:hypothetical protein GH714_005328 [Hevea brasiliensis]
MIEETYGTVNGTYGAVGTCEVTSIWAGEIPEEIGSLVALQNLNLGNNGLKGTIPINLFNCSSLQSLSLDDIGLTGTMPSEIGELRNLGYLNLQFNSLTGTIPSTLFNMTTLRVIHLWSNQFSGQLPSEFGHGLPNLEEIYLWSNQLTGQLPSSISNCSKLTVIDLGINSFSGPIPDNLGNLMNLECLHINDNLFTDESSVPELSFLSSLTSCKALIRLVLAGNPLNGTLPISIGNFSALHYFSAQSCNIKGNIPREVGQLSNLITLELQNNELIGSVPATLGRLQKLQVLHLQGNKLNGSLPNDICQMSSLGDLILSRNNLSGTLRGLPGGWSIPKSLFKLASLSVLSMQADGLTGEIPAEIGLLSHFRSLIWETMASKAPFKCFTFYVSISISLFNCSSLGILSFDELGLTGTIPSEIGELRNLEYLNLNFPQNLAMVFRIWKKKHIWSNQFSGQLPSSISNCSKLTIVALGANSFSGPIPNSLGNLRNLEVLYIPDNLLPMNLQFRN